VINVFASVCIGALLGGGWMGVVCCVVLMLAEGQRGCEEAARA